MMVNLYYYNGEVLLFDVEGWNLLRRKYRILGNLIGNINFVDVLPLRLQPEEVLLLLDKKVAKVFDKKFETTSQAEGLCKFENELLSEERNVYRSHRKRHLQEMIDTIMHAKRKAGDNRSREEILKLELEKAQIAKENMIWPLFLTSPDFTFKCNTTEISRDEILGNSTLPKYLIYKDLWERGYYITTGGKFGADFLVYLGDPIAYHSLFLVHCIDVAQSINATEIVAFGRLATAVKKRTVLATVKNDKVNYITLNWIDA